MSNMEALCSVWNDEENHVIPNQFRISLLADSSLDSYILMRIGLENICLLLEGGNKKTDMRVRVVSVN